MSVSEQLGSQREVKLRSGTLRYRERGTGPPIVFVHGIGVNGDLWREVVPRLADGNRCLAPDLPFGSHELPMEPDADLSAPGLAAIVADFMEKLDLRDVTLVGNDSGGLVSQLVATRHPDRLARLVLTPSDAFELAPPPPFGFLKLLTRVPGALAATSLLLRIPPLRRTPTAYGWAMKEGPKGAIAESYLRQGLVNGGARRDAKKAIAGVSTEHSMAVAEELPGFDRPTLIVWAADDRLFPVEIAHRLAERIPNSRVEVIEDSMTFVPEDQPARLAELIREFVREPAGSKAGV